MSKKQPSESTKNQNRFIAWLYESRGRLILLVALLEMSILIPIFINDLAFLHEQETWKAIFKGNGIWTLVVLMISAPIAFFIWKFRDENALQQLENQRKDVNLKEFHKIAEWVSGMHLVEEKITEKEKYSNSKEGEDHGEGNGDKPNEYERIREFGQLNPKQHLPTFSRQDGAVGLQIAAVQMLRPFYCGHHGEAFRKPALNLLTGAWLALFKPHEQDIKRQKNLAKSPLAVALTEAIFADGGIHLTRHPEVLPNLYLPYINLHLPGLEEEVLHSLAGTSLQGANLSRVDLSEADLSRADLSEADLSRANLSKADLSRANLSEVDLSNAILIKVNLFGANLSDTNLSGAKLLGADLSRADLSRADLSGASLSRANLSDAKLSDAKLSNTYLSQVNLTGADLFNANLTNANLTNADLTGANFIGTWSLNTAIFDHQTIFTGVLIDEQTVQQLPLDPSDPRNRELIIVNQPKGNATGAKQRWYCRSKKTGNFYTFDIDVYIDLTDTQQRNQANWEITMLNKDW